MGEWISINDRFPKKFQSVLVSDDKYVGIAEYCGETNLGYPYWTCDTEFGWVLTHWMPLPLPPKT